MDSTSLQTFLKRLCKVIWEANVTDPLTYVTQLAYLLFLKLLDEMDVDQAGNGTASRLFVRVHLPGVDKEGEETDFSQLRWSVLTSDPDNERMLRTLRDLLPRMAVHPALSPGARAIFEDARIVIPDGATLRRLVDLISPVPLLGEDADIKGDLFEALSSDLGQQKRSAQFRTPRHLIRVIVEMVNPEIGKTVCDSACGTGGFLIAAYEHIILANTSPEFVREVVTPSGQMVRRGVADKLSPSQWDFLQKGTLHGFDGEQTFVRMTAMNALLHGFDYSPIVRRDSVGGNEDKWDEIQFDFILENPPFSGAAQSPKRSLRIEKGEKYVLFLAAALRSLRPGGRARIVLSNRILSGDSNAHLEVKRRLLDECDLHAVVILPKGMFEPYTPNPTCFFIFQKTGQPTRSVWFYHVEGDGSSLKKARKFGSQFRNDFPDLLKKWRTRETQEGRAWLVPAEKIIATNYDMTPIGLGLIGPEEVEHAEPTSILAAVSGREKRAGELIDEIRSEVESERPQPDQGWDEATVKELCGKPQYGYTESATVERVGPRFLRITDIQNGEVKWDDVPYCRCEEVAKYRLADGDIVFARTGATTGKSYLVRNPPEAIFASYLIRIRPGGRVLPDYMWWYFQSSGYWASVFSGTDDGNRPNMNGSKLADLRIPFPVSKDEQWLIIARLDALAVKLAELRRLQTDTEAALATFTPAVLAKAFRGEL